MWDEIVKTASGVGKVAGAVDAVSGILGADKGPSLDDATNAQERLMWAAHNQAKEFAQFGVRWRAEDARLAGLHPLAALGVQPANPGGMPVLPGIPEGGRRGRSVAEAANNIMALEAAAASVDRDHAQAEYYRALAAKARQDPAKSVELPVGPLPAGMKDDPQAFVKVNPVDPIRHVDWVKLEADPQTASRGNEAGITAGTDHPGMREFTFPGGFKALLPATQGGGMPEEIDVSTLPLVIGANRNKYGPGWFMNLIEYMVTGYKDEELSAQGRELRRIFRKYLVPSESVFRDPKGRGLTDRR